MHAFSQMLLNTLKSKKHCFKKINVDCFDVLKWDMLN